MRSCLVTNTKGGVGKTSLTLALGVEAARAGQRTLLIDADDQQRSLSALVAERQAEAPAFAEIAGGSIADALGDGQIRAFDAVFIDGAPRATTDIRKLLGAVDFILLPIGASPMDVKASSTILQMIQAAGTPFAYVINRADSRRSVLDQVRAVISAAYPLAPTVFERADWITLAGTGQAPSEWAPTSKAAQEVGELWKYVDTHMRSSANG